MADDFLLEDELVIFELDGDNVLFVLEPEVTVFELVEVGTPGPGATLSDTAPAALGVASAGVSTSASRGDHVHPMPDAGDIDLDTGTFDGNLDGTITDVQALAEAVDELVTGSPLSNDNPAALGTAAPGVGTEVSRDDHVHPMPTPQQIPAQVVGTIAHGATAAFFGLGTSGPITIPVTCSFFYIIGAAGGTITLPPVSSYGDGQVLTIVNNSGAEMEVTASGGGGEIELSPGDAMPIGYPVLPAGGTIQGFRAFGAPGWWFADQSGGLLTDLPYWPDGVASPFDSVVFNPSGGGLPTWYRLAADDIPLNGSLLLTSTDVAAALEEVAGAAPEPEWIVPTITTKVMRCDHQAGLPVFLDGAWSTSNLGDLPDGIDIRCAVRFQRPTYTAVLPATDTFMEILTQLHPTATGGDNFELAIQWTNATFPGVRPGRPVLFYESVDEGGAAEVTAGRVEMGLRSNEWAVVRLTHETGMSTGTVTFWRTVPYQISADCETIGADIFYPVFSVTHADFASIDTGVTEDWWIGIAATMDIAWLYAEEFGSGTPLIDIQAASLDALTLGDTTFTDDAGVIWTTGAGSIANP